MTRSRRLLFTLFIFALFPFSASAQQVQTGTPVFGSYGGGPDIINLANLNSHITIPVLNKSGRGMNFNYNLIYDSSIWYPVSSNGNQSWQYTTATNWGWTTSIPRGGHVGYTTTLTTHNVICGNVYVTSYTNWAYYDGFGTPHPFSGTSDSWTSDPNCHSTGTDGFTATASDDSGYAITVNASTVNSLTASDGAVINPVTGALTLKDRNGNEITSTNASGTTSYYDTLSSTTPVLALSGSGTAASPTVFTFTPPNTSTSNCTSTNTAGVTCYAMNYTNYTVATNFGLSTVHEFGATSVPLVSSITLPDGSQYSFSYEVTPSIPAPGACTPLAGTYSAYCVTGRLKSVTFPTGGIVTYTYLGGNNGILPDGSVATLQRTVTPDGTWTYSQVKNTNAASTTTITDPSSGANQTVIQFQGIYETVHQVYQGSSTSGTLLRTWTTCYNGNLSNCATTAVNSPITERDLFDIYGATTSTAQCRHVYMYNAVGGLTEQDDYDYGPTAPGPLLRQTLITFASLGNITAFRQQVTIKDGSGNTVSQTNFNYDETTPFTSSSVAQHVSITGPRGNLTSINYPVSGLTSHSTYWDTGSPSTSEDVNGATTTSNYSSNAASCQMAFPTSLSEPLSMSRSMTWDTNCIGGVLISLKDENSQVTTITYSDPYFWRPALVNFPDGGQTSWTYNSLTSTKTTTKMNSSQNIVTTQLLDGLGRNKQQQINSDPEGVVYQDTTYDALGRVYTVSNPYRSTSDPTYGLTTYGYDPLSRTATLTLQDGSVSSASYNNNTITATDPAGKKRTSTFDSLGRLTQVTEDPSGLVYVTTYSYNALSNLTGVTQNGSRQRTYVYDALSRLTSETNPESGTVSHNYNSNGDLTTRVAPAPNQTGSTTMTISYCYDALHRPTAKAYTTSPATPPTCSGAPPTFPSPAATYTYDLSSIDGYTNAYSVGRLVKAATSDGLTATWNSYDPVGRIAAQWQCTPLNCAGSPFAKTFVYDSLGNHTSDTYSYTGSLTISYSYDAAGRPTQVTSNLVDSQHPATLATVDPSLGYYPQGALRKITYGNGLTGTAAFNNDLQPCRINVNSSATALGACADAVPSGNLLNLAYGYNAGTADNGHIASWSAVGQQSFNRSYTYDSLNRLQSMTAPGDSCSGLSWTYDAWGNRTDQTNTGGTCSTFHQTVNTQNQLLGPPYVYDAAGNMIQDSNHTYTYDAENRLTQVDGGSTASYVYDAVGLRARKTVGSSATDYLYDLSGRVFSEFSPAWSAGAVYLNGQFLAEYYGGTTYFVHSDHLGSTRLLTGLDQSVFDNMDYLPFGEQIAGGTGTTLKFTGDERDSETSLDHTWFRQYSSSNARWMTPDPAGLAAADMLNPQSWNRYAYASNDPCGSADPLGLVTCTFKISVTNSIGLNTSDLVDALTQIANIFSQNSDGNGNAVNVNFTFGGQSDYSVDFKSGWFYPNKVVGHTGCLPILGCSSTSSVYVDNINKFYNSPPGPSYFGSVGAHELIDHAILGNSLDNCSDPNNIECSQNINEQQPSPTNNALTSGQVADLLKQCLKLHPTHTAGGGGGTGDFSIFDWLGLLFGGGGGGDGSKPPGDKNGDY